MWLCRDLLYSFNRVEVSALKQYCSSLRRWERAKENSCFFWSHCLSPPKNYIKNKASTVDGCSRVESETDNSFVAQARTPQQFIVSLCPSVTCTYVSQLVNFLPAWVHCEFHPWARSEESVCLHSLVQHSTPHHFFSKTVLRAERDRRAERPSINS
jgi:hypothetical protein